MQDDGLFVRRSCHSRKATGACDVGVWSLGAPAAWALVASRWRPGSGSLRGRRLGLVTLALCTIPVERTESLPLAQLISLTVIAASERRNEWRGGNGRARAVGACGIHASRVTFPLRFRCAECQVGKVEVWRIENFDMVPLAPDKYGQFFSGDSYVILHSYLDAKGRDAWVIYFWLGRHRSVEGLGRCGMNSDQGLASEFKMVCSGSESDTSLPTSRYLSTSLLYSHCQVLFTCHRQFSGVVEPGGSSDSGGVA